MALASSSLRAWYDNLELQKNPSSIFIARKKSMFSQKCRDCSVIDRLIRARIIEGYFCTFALNIAII